MRRIPVEKLEAGMQLARPIYSKGGRVLLDKGIKLKEGYIKRLVEFGITHVYVYDERIGDLDVDEIVNEETRLQAAEIVRQAVANIRFGVDLNVREIKRAVMEIMDQVLFNRETLAHLSEIRIVGEFLFHHSVNVAIYALLTGIAMGYNSGQLLDLGTGALLHDIGKSRMPARLLNTCGPLAGPEAEEMKNHTVYGFDLLRKENDLSLLSAHVAFQHHERFDGTGYPRGLKGTEIHEYARIAAVADTYDLLVSGLEGTRLLPYQTVEYIVAQAGHAFDPEVVKLFSTNIAVYPLGSLVRLNTGEKGVVIQIPRNYPTRPVIKVLYDATGKPYQEGFPEVDLLKELTVFVDEVLEE
ncbi:MAG: HD-GYP domain-containing protein [Bacillota bacterium]|nr:HD-GYP domain-containing protein [Bacillota bacterium]